MANFSLSYAYFSTLSDILRASGLWTPVPNSNWQAWATSLAQSGFNPRGNAQLAMLPTDDIIMNICSSNTPPTVQNTALRAQLPFNTRAKLDNQGTDNDAWLTYASLINLEDDNNVTEIRTLPPNSVLPPPPADDDLTETTSLKTVGNPFDDTSGGAQQTIADGWPGAAGFARLANSGSDSPVVGIPGGSLSNNTGSTVQARTRPLFTVILEGYAIRVSLPVDTPTILSVGGVPVISANRAGIEYNKKWLSASILGTNYYAACWRQRFLVPGLPTGSVFTPGNPIYGS
jgi:hypothetical protein